MTFQRLLVGLLSIAALVVDGSTAEANHGDDSVVATFEEGTIDLAGGWREAGACHVDAAGTRCYRTEGEMNEVESQRAQTAQRFANCSTSLRLYRATGFGGGVLSLSLRGSPISLAPYGFNNDTSSYRVGACSSTFYDGAAGSTTYPGNTSAGASASSMFAGRDNRVSTVYIS